MDTRINGISTPNRSTTPNRNTTPNSRNMTPTMRNHLRNDEDVLPIPSIESFSNTSTPISLSQYLGLGPRFKSNNNNSNNNNNRSNSAGKATTQRVVYETVSQIRSTSAYRPRSRRKERRFENDNMFGIGNIKNWSKDNDDEDEVYTIYDIKKGAFGDLFTQDNMDVLQLFRSCNESTFTDSNCNNSRRYMRRDQWETAERAWYKIEKRLRTIIPTILNNVQICLYLRALELILIYFMEKQSVPPVNTIPHHFIESLEHPLIVSTNNNQQFLTITLKESSFKRLLLHATCQFYGMKSKSFNSKDGNRSTIITTSKRKNSNDDTMNCSMIKYLLCTMKNVKEEDYALDSLNI